MNSDLTIWVKRRKCFVRVNDKGKYGWKRIKSIDRIGEKVRVMENEKRKRKLKCKRKKRWKLHCQNCLKKFSNVITNPSI